MRDFESRFNAAIHSPITSDLLTHVSHQASRVIPCHPAPVTAAKPTTHVDNDVSSATLVPESANPQAWPPPLRTFISVVVKRSSVRAGTLFATLVFLERLQKRLERVARGMPCTCHRIFLATLIVTSKALHDASPKNKHWAKYAMWCFSLSEINLMEKQLLSILNYRLLITLDDLHHVYSCYASLRLPTPVTIPSSSSSSSSTLASTSTTKLSTYPPSLSSSIGTASNESLEETSSNNASTASLPIVQPPLPPYLLPKNDHHHQQQQVNIFDKHNTISHHHHHHQEQQQQRHHNRKQH
ncbi:hypothetical protein BDB00DRAFT_829694 [Zychaea mexicana]|uniref:uncharacterized protein n=1 Tax=Zychaea mexicana TaxID=64656 RepID=UPI0022FEEF44|nr:uncharacterized protein BDB00DRAFT_829694 [Zychaea mexicana]KAI9492219.1 hypothetical protein BDB00DRAFT_829694 [Zychaea mexicana]